MLFFDVTVEVVKHLVYLSVLLGHESSWHVRRPFDSIINTVSLLAFELKWAVPIVSSLISVVKFGHQFNRLCALQASKSRVDSIFQNIHVPVLERCRLTAVISLLGQEFLSLLCQVLNDSVLGKEFDLLAIKLWVDLNEV